MGDTKLIAENETAQVKVEVNAVFRGTVLPVVRRPKDFMAQAEALEAKFALETARAVQEVRTNDRKTLVWYCLVLPPGKQGQPRHGGRA